MNAVHSLIFANIALWLGFAVYAVILARKQANIQKQITMLSLQSEDSAE